MADDQGTRTEIGPDTVVTGDVQADEDVVVFGRIDGTVASTTAVIVEEGGQVGPRVQAPTVIVAGWAAGDVVGNERVEITETGRVAGSVYAPRLVLLEGGAIRGRVVMDGTRPESAPENVPVARATATRTAASAPATARRPAAASVRAAREPVSASRARAAAANTAPAAPAHAVAGSVQLDLGEEIAPKDA